MSKVKRPGQLHQGKVQGKIRKFAFTLDDDIRLLKSSIQNNPFQLGADKWNDVLVELRESNPRPGLSVRGIRDRVQLLKTKYLTEQLTSRTGTEESRSERAELLEEVIRLVEEAENPIIQLIGAEDIEVDNEIIFDQLELQLLTDSSDKAKPIKDQKKSFAKEKKAADLERAELLNEKPESPVSVRPSRNREDDLIKEKMQDEFKLENRKLDLEERKLAETFEIQKEQLALESKKEDRLADESKRRDELASAQLKMNADMIMFMQAVLKTKE